MKLYATTTSERATKGQGGKHIEFTLQNELKNILIRYDIVFNETVPNYRIRVYDGDINFIKVLKNHLAFYLDTKKGEKQKGENYIDTLEKYKSFASDNDIY
jgi:hypothetical protein